MKKFFNNVKSIVKYVVSFVIFTGTLAASPALLMSKTGLGRKGVAVSLLALISYVWVATEASIGFFGSVFGETIFTQLPWYGWYMAFMLCVIMYYEVCKAITKATEAKVDVKASEASTNA